jgi:hypothetical protein
MAVHESKVRRIAAITPDINCFAPKPHESQAAPQPPDESVEDICFGTRRVRVQTVNVNQGVKKMAGV